MTAKEVIEILKTVPPDTKIRRYTPTRDGDADDVDVNEIEITHASDAIMVVLA